MEPAGGFHPIDSVVNDMKDKVSFYNIGAEFELNPVCIGTLAPFNFKSGNLNE